MVSGLLKEMIEIHSPDYSKNEYGEVYDTVYKEKYKCRAQVTFNSGNRSVENEEIVNNYSLQFTIRIYNNVNEKDRVKYIGNFYNIDAIEVNKQYQYKKLYCSKINE